MLDTVNECPGVVNLVAACEERRVTRHRIQ
jgi:hypothetical protein